jgi:hypothetical protein
MSAGGGGGICADLPHIFKDSRLRSEGRRKSSHVQDGSGPFPNHKSLVALQIPSGLIKNTEVPEGSYEE